jgi:hypothetical protein
MNKLKPIMGRILAFAMAAMVLGPLAHAADFEKSNTTKAVAADTNATVEKTRACNAQKVLFALANTEVGAAAMTPVAASPLATDSVVEALSPIYPGVCSYDCSVNCWRTRDCRGLGTCMRYCP